MNRETAEALLVNILDIERLIDEGCVILRAVEDLGERKRYIRILARALAEISGGIILPLAKMYPGIIDLEVKPKE